MTARDQRARPGRIAVVGAGALGQLYAALLTQVAPGAVTLFTRRPEAQAQLRREIVVTRPHAVVRQQGVDAQLAGSAAKDTFDLVLVLVSAYDTAQVAPWVARLLRPEGLCITMQNGLGNQPALAQVLGDARVSVGATSFATHLEGDGAVHVDGDGLTWVPTLPPHLEWWPALLEAADLRPKRVGDARHLLWRKAAIATNGFIALILAAPLGRVVRTPHGREIAHRASLEITQVARAAGVDLGDAEVTDALQTAWAHCNPQALSSMYSDYVAGKRTELEERLGEIVERARPLAVAVPTLEALLLLCRARLELGAVTA